jgi:hypothetical protein
VTVIDLDRKTFAMSDQQWGEIAKCVKLPDESRADIDFAIHAYRGQRQLWDDKPSEVAKKLRDTSAAALRLLELLDGVRKREQLDLIEVGYGSARLDVATAEITALAVC